MSDGSRTALLAADLADLRATMHRRGAMFCFSGFMTEPVLTGLGSALRKKLEVEDMDRKTVKGIFSVFVELVQNVIRYSAERDTGTSDREVVDLRYGVVAVGRQEGQFYIACGNLIENKDVERLSSGLENILSLDREELKDLYKSTLRGPTPETSKGAGVGFIEIARKAPNGFEFDFEKIDDNHSFFAVRARM